MTYTLPPHPLVVSCLVLMLRATLFTIGVAILGGGVFGFVGAIAAGLAGAALLLEPTPIVLSHVATPVTCRLRGDHGDFTGGGDFSVDCTGGRRYTFTTKHDLLFPERRVQVLADPHGILATEYVGQHQLTEDLLGGTVSILVAAGVVVAAGPTGGAGTAGSARCCAPETRAGGRHVRPPGGYPVPRIRRTPGGS